MKTIDKIDENLKIETSLNLPDAVWYSAKDTSKFTVKGVIPFENGFIRMEKEAAERVSENVASLNHHTSGGRLFFETDANYIAFRAKGSACQSAVFSIMSSSGADMYIDEGNGYFHFNIFIPPSSYTEGTFEKLAELENNRHYKHLYRKMKRKVMIYLPLYSCCEDLYLGFPEDATVNPFEPYNQPPIVYYGSSITQGACASRPGNAYPAVVSRKTDTDFLCLGFSGAAHGEQEMAEYIAGLSMSLFVMEYDHNDCVSPDLLKERHLKFYETVRNKNPELPIIIMSAPFSYCNEEMYKKSHDVVKETYEIAKKRGDNVYFIDGMTIFDGPFKDCATADDSHPNDYGFIRMADAVIKEIKL